MQRETSPIDDSPAEGTAAVTQLSKQMQALVAQLEAMERERATRAEHNEAHSRDQEYFTAKQVCGRFGVTDMTLWRWLVRTDLGFPRPIVISRRRYFLISDIKAWERARAARSMGTAK